jgi:hypothetical protein
MRLQGATINRIEPDRIFQPKKGVNPMAGSKLTIKLTDEQQNQIRTATGKSITELNIDVAASGPLTEKDLDSLSGGIGLSPKLDS